MNKNEFLRAVAEKAGKTLKETSEFYDAYNAVVHETLKEGEKIVLAGWGTYEAQNKAACVRKNPQTGKEVKVAACKAPKLKFGKSFKTSLN